LSKNFGRGLGALRPRTVARQFRELSLQPVEASLIVLHFANQPGDVGLTLGHRGSVVVRVGHVVIFGHLPSGHSWSAEASVDTYPACPVTVHPHLRCVHTPTAGLN
jgi:hypothetical protein